jgi:transcriptional regulator with XRE-family HTH domain
VDDETARHSTTAARTLAATAIRRTREHLGLSQERLALRAGVSVRTVRSLELSATGSPRADTLSRIASALDLDAVSRGRVLAAWGHRGEEGEAGFAFGNAPMIEEMRRFSSSVTLLHVDQNVSVSSGRARVRSTTRITGRVRRGTVAHAYVVAEPDPRPAAFDLTEMEGCAVNADETSGTGVRVVRLALERPAQEHDIFTLSYTQVRRPTVAAPPPVDHAGAGFQTPTDLYTLRVWFDPRAFPQRIHQCAQDHPFGERRAVRAIPLSRSGNAVLAIERPRRGGHLLRWEW